MERKIGEIFDYDGKSYQVIYGRGCRNCDIKDLSNYNSIKTVAGYCSRDCRKEGNEVVFKEINSMKDNEKKGTIAEMYACANDELKKVLESKFSKEELGIKKELPNSWEEFVEQNPCKNVEYDIGLNGVQTTCAGLRGTDEHSLPTRKMADAFIALMDLIQLRDCYRNGWEPDWDDYGDKYCIYRGFNSIRTINSNLDARVLSFQSRELRDKFLNNFRYLIEIAKDLI